MKTSEIIKTALHNVLHGRSRALLTILAVLVGAFTLSITTAAGLGASRYIEDLTASFGGENVMFAAKPVKQEENKDRDAPDTYDANNADASASFIGGEVTKLTETDLRALEDFDGVKEVDPWNFITTQYVQVDDHRYKADVIRMPGQEIQLAEGEQLDDKTSELQVLLPVNYVEPLGFDNNEEALNKTIVIGLQDAAHEQRSVEAKIVGIAEKSLNADMAKTLTPNDALEKHLVEVQNTGLPDSEAKSWGQAVLWLDSGTSAQEVTELKEQLSEDGYEAQTITDLIDRNMAVINAITIGLNIFAAVALLAAALGIANTLLMSVQERTKQIGLMKAVGMRGHKIFALFTWEAVLLGLLGSLMGIFLASTLGGVANTALSNGPLAQLPGLNLFSFAPTQVLTIILLIVAIAFIAGTLPALRAARKEPIEALRYE